jgi:hypothetical protein
MAPQYCRRRSLVIYQCALSMILSSECQSYVDAVSAVVHKAAKDEIVIPRL